MALRKVGVALIGVFGAAMEEMQVSLTLVLVFFYYLAHNSPATVRRR